ncbi:MAG: tRNA (adenosine(37)-N6)-threonylcarbamoyltransferase complex transferase subunit TsaD, partial [Opitutales bacterium]|nr:tRNA (adenosine(37)-N6)-threonylcarbamoyltransferase complex transferase subunit TsaD [Opitutales bacterium]
DKGAKLLGLGYPGGPKLEAIARPGYPEAYDFPRALMERANFDFSFSGLKTSLRYLLEGISEAELDRRLPDICSSYQEAVVDALIQKTGKALRNREYRSVGLSGGVSNNGLLRQRFRDLAIGARLTPLLARKEHTGDNAGMIAFSRIFEKSKDLEMKIDIHPGARITHVF